MKEAVMSVPMIVAEIGSNHRGDMHTALRMVEIVARYCTEHFQLDGSRPRVGVKFQKRTPRLTLEDFNRPHPHPHHAYGPTYGEHREALEFTALQHRELKEKCEAEGVVYSSSVWDLQAAEEIIGLNPEWIKVPSARNQDWPLLERLISWGGPMHISLGMTTHREFEELLLFLRNRDALGRTVLYHCTSDYPVAMRDVRLDEIRNIWMYVGKSAAGVGFSGHHNGIEPDLAAAFMGVSHIERHFTLNRTWKGTDHAASLEPDGLRRLIRGVGVVAAARGNKGESGLLDCEMGQRAKLKGITAEVS